MRAEFESIYKDYVDVETPQGRRQSRRDRQTDQRRAGFTVTQRRYPHDLHYTAQQWVDIAFTFSNHLLVPADKAGELRTRLAERIGAASVSVGGDAVTMPATPA